MNDGVPETTPRLSVRPEVSQFHWVEFVGKGLDAKLGGVVSDLAATDCRIVLLGETGVGKEVVAKTIHLNSSREHRALVTVNCSAIPDELIESELFGHERGAFTGASERQIGLFELADRGTIFLDEIGDMSLTAQAKVLRVLQDGDFQPLGSKKPQKVDVRVIVATNHDLLGLIEKRKFREDLFYRLGAISIVVPPLRERPEDIIPLAEHFLKMYLDAKVRTMTPKGTERLLEENWPGNVRQLRNVVEGASLLARSEAIDVPDIQARLDATSPRK